MPKAINKITKKCTNCGKEIIRFPSQFTSENSFCSPKCNNTFNAKSGKDSQNWKSGKTINRQGYILIKVPGHHRTRKDRYVLEHIVIIEKKLGRQLKNGEVVHHINHNRQDNRPENLKLYGSTTEHINSEHKKKKSYCECGFPVYANNLCRRHHRQYVETGKTWDFENKNIRVIKKCFCGDIAISRNMCSKHYQRWYKKNKK